MYLHLNNELETDTRALIGGENFETSQLFYQQDTKSVRSTRFTRSHRYPLMNTFYARMALVIVAVAEV